jgi:PIN domain nuclease of toxin-antitoxin system
MLSVASLWEMAIKVGLGRPSVAASSGLPFSTAVEQQLATNNIKALPILPKHALAISSLPQNTGHNDPFDRLLVVQATMEHMPLISVDARLDVYGVARIW